MSRWLQLARSTSETKTPLPDTPTEPDKSPPPLVDQTFCPLLSGCRVDNSPQERRSPVALSEADLPADRGVGGRPKCWQGKVVSLAEWRELSEWDRWGPRGRVWSPFTRRWEEPDEAIQPDGGQTHVSA